MKDLKTILAISILFMSCGQKPDSVSLEKTADSTSNELQSNIAESTQQATPSLLDSTLYHFTKAHLHPGKHMMHVRYPYKPYRDTLTINVADSIIVYRYPVDTIANHYSAPFQWSEHFTDWGKTVAKNSEVFIEHIRQATFCQGVIYAQGDQQIESFAFNTEAEAIRAKELFDGTNGYIFPKTLSFAKQNALNFYVFHARYMGPSWYSKKEFERFEKYLEEKRL